MSTDVEPMVITLVSTKSILGRIARTVQDELLDGSTCRVSSMPADVMAEYIDTPINNTRLARAVVSIPKHNRVTVFSPMPKHAPRHDMDRIADEVACDIIFRIGECLSSMEATL